MLLAPPQKRREENHEKGTENPGKSPLPGLPHQRFPETSRDTSAVILPAKLRKYVGHKIKEKSSHLISMLKKKKKEATQTEKQNENQSRQSDEPVSFMRLCFFFTHFEGEVGRGRGGKESRPGFVGWLHTASPMHSSVPLISTLPAH